MVCRSAGLRTRRGFTLVELLVVSRTAFTPVAS